MTDNYAALGDIVTQSRQLLDLIKGGALAKFDQDAKAFLANMQDVVPNIAISGNQILALPAAGTIPTHFGAHARVTMERVIAIDGQPQLRTPEMKAMLTEMQTGVQTQFPDFNIRADDYYRDSFNVYRVSWDFTGYDKARYLVYPMFKGAGIPLHSIAPVTAASQVKLESGSLETNLGYYLEGAELGAWRFGHTVFDAMSSFGSYLYLHPFAKSIKGSFLMALPVVATGYLYHPNKLFCLPELSS